MIFDSILKCQIKNSILESNFKLKIRFDFEVFDAQSSLKQSDGDTVV